MIKEFFKDEQNKLSEKKGLLTEELRELDGVLGELEVSELSMKEKEEIKKYVEDRKKKAIQSIALVQERWHQVSMILLNLG